MKLKTCIINSENSIIIYFAKQINPKILIEINNLTTALKKNLAIFIIDLVPSYTSLTVFYDLNKITADDICKKINKIITTSKYTNYKQQTNNIRIPVYYNSSVAPDLNELLTIKNLALKEFITIHTNPTYLVYAVGFLPNFAYLGTVDKKIQIPRLTAPRLSVIKGSVAIADNQTGVYPSASPAGWRIIGRSPLNLAPPCDTKFQISDTVNFYSIDKAQFLQQGGVL